MLQGSSCGFLRTAIVIFLLMFQVMAAGRYRGRRKVPAGYMISNCVRSCGLCNPTLPLTQLWDAPAGFFFGSASDDYRPILPQKPQTRWLVGNGSPQGLGKSTHRAPDPFKQQGGNRAPGTDGKGDQSPHKDDASSTIPQESPEVFKAPLSHKSPAVTDAPTIIMRPPRTSPATHQINGGHANGGLGSGATQTVEQDQQQVTVVKATAAPGLSVLQLQRRCQSWSGAQQTECLRLASLNKTYDGQVRFLRAAAVATILCPNFFIYSYTIARHIVHLELMVHVIVAGHPVS
jgi:hypothetical protein